MHDAGVYDSESLEDNRFVLRISVKDEDVDFGGLRARVWHLQFN